MGDIGTPKRQIEFEPMPEEAPIQEPSPVVEPVEPEKVPAGHER